MGLNNNMHKNSIRIISDLERSPLLWPIPDPAENASIRADTVLKYRIDASLYICYVQASKLLAQMQKMRDENIVHFIAASSLLPVWCVTAFNSLHWLVVGWIDVD